VTNADRRAAFDLYVDLGVDRDRFCEALKTATPDVLGFLRALLVRDDQAARDRTLNAAGAEIVDEVARTRCLGIK
jgi:hypothetical protein